MYCQVQGHKMNKIVGVCTFKLCTQDIKYVCFDCLSQQIHSHGFNTFDHIMQQEQSHEQQEIQLLNISYQDNLFLQTLQNNEVSIQIYDTREKIFPEQEQQISHQKELFKFDNYMRYESKEYIGTAQISNDQKILGIGGLAEKIYIIWLQNKKLYKIIKFHGEVTIIKFTNDSKYLLSGINKGYLYCHDITNNFKLIFMQQVHSKSINDIIAIDNNQILTCSSDNSLIITNIQNKQQLLIIPNQQNKIISAVEYNKNRDHIIYSDDHSLKFINRKDGNQLQMNQQKAHKDTIYQIQLLSNSDSLISSCYYELFLWQIDYESLQLRKIKQFKTCHYNLTSVLYDQKLIIITEKDIQILNNDLDLLESINHKVTKFWYYFQTRQLNTLNYVIVLGKNNIQILKRA